jgi:hypothetical protein
MSKKILILVGFICVSYIGTAQKLAGDSKWNISTTLGSIQFFNTSELNVRDRVNVGLSLEATRVFDNNLFVSAGTTFSTLKNIFLWENTLNYFSIDLYGGYVFKFDGLSEFTLATGTSFISAPNTIPDGNSSFSFNVSGGFIFWLNDSNFGIIIRNTYKSAIANNFVSHNRFSLGLAYKL